MRIANNALAPRPKTARAGLILLAAAVLFPLSSACADTVPLPPPASGMPAVTPVVAPLPSPAPAAPAMVAPTASIAPYQPAKPPNGDIETTLSAMEDKATENAKDLTKHLDGSADALTFEDLNTARQTSARIDALIEVEKRLGELQKIRNERTGSGGGALVNAIPASALAPPPSLRSGMPAPMETPMAPVIQIKPHSAWSNTEISRITGAEGKYTALLKLPDGDTPIVRVGDEIGGGGVVRWISSSAVGIEEKGVTHTLHVKNVDMVYSALH